MIDALPLKLAIAQLCVETLALAVAVLALLT